MESKSREMREICLKSLFAQIQIQSELSRKAQFRSCDIQSNVLIQSTGNETEIADFVVKKYNIVEIYLIRPAVCAYGTLYRNVKKRLKRIAGNYSYTYGADCNSGSERFFYFSPCMHDSRRLLVYWCDGDGVIYYQFCRNAEFLYMIKLFVTVFTLSVYSKNKNKKLY